MSLKEAAAEAAVPSEQRPENIVAEVELWDGRTLVIDVTDEDPGDFGEPRSVDVDGKTYLAVRAAYRGPAWSDE